MLFMFRHFSTKNSNVCNTYNIIHLIGGDHPDQAMYPLVPLLSLMRLSVTSMARFIEDHWGSIAPLPQGPSATARRQV